MSHCAEPGCGVTRYCVQCTLCLRAYCSEHIPLENHSCATGPTANEGAAASRGAAAASSSSSVSAPPATASAAGSVPGAQRIDSGGSASGGTLGVGVGGATRASSGGSYDRRPRSRDSPARILSGGAAASTQPSLGGVLSSGLGGSGSVSGLGLGLGLGLHGSSGGSSGGAADPHELASPDYVKRLSSSSPLSLTGLLRRTSSLPGGRSLGGPGSQSQNGLLPPSYNRTPSGLGLLGSPGALNNGGLSTGGVSGSLPRGLSAMFQSPSHGGLGEHVVSGGSNGSGAGAGGALEYARLDSLMRGGSIPPHDASLLLHQHLPAPSAGESSPLSRKQLGTPDAHHLHSASSRLPRLRSRDAQQAPQSSTDLFAVMRGQESQQQQQLQQQHPMLPASVIATAQPTAAGVAAAPPNKRKDPSPLDSAAQSADRTPRGKKTKLAQQQQQLQQEQQQQEAHLAVPVKIESASASRRSPQVTKRQLAAAAAAPLSTSFAASAPSHYALLSPAAAAASANPSDPRAMAQAYEHEYARMEQVVDLLTAWPSSPAPASASAAAAAATPAVMAADDIVKAFQRESLQFQRDQTLIAEASPGGGGSTTAAGASAGDSPTAASSASAMAVAMASHRRLRICEAIVLLSFTAPERAQADAASASGPTSLAPLSLPSAARIPSSFHSLFPLVSRALCLLSNALMLSELELAVLSLFLDRLLGDWVSHTDLRVCAAEGCNLRLLHYVAYMVKLAFSDSAAAGGGGSDDPLLGYLCALYPDFHMHFTQWMHAQGSTTLATPPLQLNQRFKVITAQAGNAAGSNMMRG